MMARRRYIILLTIGIYVSFFSIADEGMWLPQLLQITGVYQKMKQAGCKLTPEQIYSVNHSSLKDAVVLFGGGCTGEIISEKGLLITNHHCGYSSIAGLSSVEKNYLRNGYWAKNHQEELYCPNLSVSIVVRIEDVTKEVISGTVGKEEKERGDIVQRNIQELVSRATQNTHYNAVVKSYNYDLQYFLIVYETFKDVRLVAAPPEHIGQFGGEDDNWTWPRHNADFALFRIYASKDNKPAEYSPDNVPYRPKYVISVSLKGYKEGDFTMVYGFPGRTEEYLSSYGVDVLINDIYPRRVRLRDAKLKILDKYMKQSADLNLKYANTYTSVSNYYKKWMGEMLGLKQFNAIEKKKISEDLLKRKLKNKSAIDSFETMMKIFSDTYPRYRYYQMLVDYYQECFMAVDAIKYIGYYVDFFTEYNRMKMGFPHQLDKIKIQLMKNVPYQFYLPADREIFVALMSLYFQEIREGDRVPILDSIYRRFDEDIQKMADYLYEHSLFLNTYKMKALLEAPNDQRINDFESDLFYRLVKSIKLSYYLLVLPNLGEVNSKINTAQRMYVKLKIDYEKGQQFYPDANSSLRIAFGKVMGYKPRDGVEYGYYTTSEGILEKENSENPYYYVDDTLRTLFLQKDFGRYADKDGKLHIAFIASNHTTGGNSGSPVFNANGELIGTNFDRCWEGTMSDIMYHPDICRNIILDIRYTLFLLDKYAKCKWLLEEIKIVK